MKYVKKVSAILLAVMIMLAVSVTAFAVDGSLTVKNSETGTTYNFYKILNLSGQATQSSTDGRYDAVTYTLDDTFKDFFIGESAPGKAYIVDKNDEAGTLNQINVDGTLMYLNITETNRVALTNDVMKYVIDNNITEDKSAEGSTGSDVAVTGLELGYYLMIPQNADLEKSNPVTSGSVASLTSTVPDADIYVKATKPTIAKIDKTISADVGTTVPYELTGTVPNTSGTATYVYKITDEMTSGLTFQKDVAITIDGEEVPAEDVAKWLDYTTDNKFVATIPVVDYQNKIGKEIKLTYSAIVNDNAVASSQEKNKAKVEYGHKPDATEESTPVEEEVYSAKIIINKHTDDAETGAKLADAKFALMNSEGKYYKYTAATETEPAKVEWVAVENAPISGTANVTDAMAKALEDATNITTKTTDANGAASFDGVADGTYYLVEFKAPEGYNRLDKPQSVEVKGTDVDSEEHPENVAFAGQKEFDAAQDATANVQNKSGSVLPSTGGMGTTLFTVIGSALMAGAVVVFVARRKMA